MVRQWITLHSKYSVSSARYLRMIFINQEWIALLPRRQDGV